MGWGKSHALGTGLGLIIGAKLAAPDKFCVNFMGDAAFGMTGLDFETAVRCGIPITHHRAQQLDDGDRDATHLVVSHEKYGTRDIGGNYADMGRAMGGWSERVERPEEIARRLRAGAQGQRERAGGAARIHHQPGDALFPSRRAALGEMIMADYIPSPRQWVRDQVELYERSGGKEGTTLRDTGLPVIIVTHKGNKTGATRKTPLMRVQDGANYVLVGSVGGAPANPVWVYNLRANPTVEIRDLTSVQPMRVREVNDDTERARLWKLAVAAFPPYEEYQAKTTRRIPLFVAEPKR